MEILDLENAASEEKKFCFRELKADWILQKKGL